PARWKGCLEHKLAAPTKVRPVVHRKAMPYADLPAFIVDLRKGEEISARALEFMILTVARPEAIRFMQWGELDKDRTYWTAPGQHMKGKKNSHRVPLSAPARALILALERDLPPERSAEAVGERLVFPALRGRRMSDATMNKLLQKTMDRPYDG